MKITQLYQVSAHLIVIDICCRYCSRQWGFTKYYITNLPKYPIDTWYYQSLSIPLSPFMRYHSSPTYTQSYLSSHQPISNPNSKVLTFTPDSSLSPPHQDDSEDESSFMTHTQVDCHRWNDDEGGLDHNFEIFSSFQHLVDVMEARIKQVTQTF